MKPTHSDRAAQLLADIRCELENMVDLRERICRMLECSYTHAEELAALFTKQRAATADGSTASPPLPPPQEISDFAEHHAAGGAALAAQSPQHDRLLRRLLSHLSVSEQLCFYLALTSGEQCDTASIAQRLFGAIEPAEQAALGAIAYQHSIYTDEAFLHFSRVFPKARAVYSSSFAGVCEQVFNGKCEYCILPLENTEDGKLVRFYQLIEKYELKIALTCKVTTSDNRHSTVFGLCRRGLTWPQLPLPDRAFCFELVFWQEPEHADLGELLTAAAACSLTLLRADCLPRSDEEILIGAGYPFALCFEAGGEEGDDHRSRDHIERDFLAFLFYLSVHSPTYLPLGIYQRL